MRGWNISFIQVQGEHLATLWVTNADILPVNGEKVDEKVTTKKLKTIFVNILYVVFITNMTDEIYNTVDLLYLKNTPKKKNGELFTAPAVFFQTCLPPHLFIATEYTNNKSLKSTSCTRKMHAALCLTNWGFYLPSDYTNLCLNEDYISFTVLTDF